MGTKVYDSNEVSVVFGGVIIDSGREDGDFVKITSEDQYTDKAGADGEVTRSQSNDNRADAEIIIMQTSDSNILLSAIHEADKIAPNGTSVVPFMLKDNNGTMLATAAHAWIKKHPDIVRGKEAGPVSWPIRIANLVQITGGNSDI